MPVAIVSILISLTHERMARLSYRPTQAAVGIVEHRNVVAANDHPF